LGKVGLGFRGLNFAHTRTNWSSRLLKKSADGALVFIVIP
jgi:hypothetical protein